MGRSTPLARIHRLFKLGETLHLGDDEDGPIVFWVKKPNDDEREEAFKDGQFAAAKRRAGLLPDADGNLPDEMQIVKAEASSLTQDELITALVTPESGSHWALARDDVHADEDWQEDLILIDRGQLVEDGEEASDEEKKRLNEVSTKYLKAIQDRFEQRVKDAKLDLEGTPHDKLVEKYLDSYRHVRGRDEFQTAHERTVLWYCLCICKATRREDGSWDHQSCTHPRFLNSRAQVRELPDEVKMPARKLLDDMEMSASAVKN